MIINCRTSKVLWIEAICLTNSVVFLFPFSVIIESNCALFFFFFSRLCACVRVRVCVLFGNNETAFIGINRAQFMCEQCTQAYRQEPKVSTSAQQNKLSAAVNCRLLCRLLFWVRSDSVFGIFRILDTNYHEKLPELNETNPFWYFVYMRKKANRTRRSRHRTNVKHFENCERFASRILRLA